MVGLLGNVQVISVNSFLILLSIFLFIWYYLKNKFSYWSSRGVPYINPAKCFLNTMRSMFGLQQFFFAADEHYKRLEGHKYGGTFQLTEPTLLLRDPEVIKLALIKGFPNFHDRALPQIESNDRLSDNLFALTGEKWHQVRRNLSPGFSAVKLKLFHQSLQSCAKELDTHLQELCSRAGDAEVDVREAMSNYTLDVIGACAMGVECDAIRNPNSEFKRILMKAFEFNLRTSVVFLLTIIHPKLPQFFRLRFRDIEVEEFCVAVCKNAMEMKANDASSTRTDFLQIMMNLRSHEMEKLAETIEELTDEAESPYQTKKTKESEGPIFSESVLLGVISVFLFAGFEAVASALTFCFYELALHPEIQDKVLKEIQALGKDSCDDITYEDLKKLQYIDQVINETLRKYPVAGTLIRRCNESFRIPDSSVVVEEGVTLFIPVWSLHHDPQFFPEPEKFDPERFSPANIDKIVPGSYLPFGDGPRFCIAMRFALLDIKTMVVTLVSNYTLHMSAKTPKPMEFDQKGFILSPKGGLWLRLQKRK